jgi:hypothetical protein
MKRALFVQSTLIAHGGANAVAVWMMEALKGEYEITLLTWRPPDFDALNAHYGTNLRQTDVRVLCPVHLPARWLIQAIPDTGTVQIFSYLLRKAKRLGRAYDVILTAEMESDFGRPGIQYVHFPYIRSEYSRRAHSLDMPLLGRLRALSKGLDRPALQRSIQPDGDHTLPARGRRLSDCSLCGARERVCVRRPAPSRQAAGLDD